VTSAILDPPPAFRNTAVIVCTVPAATDKVAETGPPDCIASGDGPCVLEHPPKTKLKQISRAKRIGE
jgi:hypothetical protein